MTIALNINKGWRRTALRLLAGIALGAGVFVGTSAPASAAVTANFGSGVLSVSGDSLDNPIVVSRDTTGKILINGGALAVAGDVPTVANTTLIQVSGQDGNDKITLNEANGALPAAHLSGGNGNDTLTGGSGADQLLGQADNDELIGKSGNDLLSGGDGSDTLTGGTGDEQDFGQAGNDRMVWNPGDGTDLNEGGDGVDTVQVNGGSGAEQFTASPNGTRVRFDRVQPAPFSLDIGTTEKLVVNASGGDDSFVASDSLAAPIAITVDGGAGNDTLIGSRGNDVLIGGDGEDAVIGMQGNDVVLLGAGNDVFDWNPGDGSDTVEGQDGIDAVAFHGANVAENFNLSANGNRVRLSRDVANVTMDLDGIERIALDAFGGANKVTVNDLSGTGVTEINPDLSVTGGGGDGAADNVIVNGTSIDDTIPTAGDGSDVAVLGLAARIDVTGAEAANDTLTINGLGGNDVIQASGLTANAIKLMESSDDGDDMLIGGDGNDTLFGGAGDDVPIGGPGTDVLDGGTGNNELIQ